MPIPTENAVSVLFEPKLLAPVPYYIELAKAGEKARLISGLRFNKRNKAMHRTTIADTRGIINLTIPVQHDKATTWDDVKISSHGEWWRNHSETLASAYGRTPFYEFYIDRFAELFNPKSAVGQSVTQYNISAHKEICKILLLEDTPVATAEECVTGKPAVIGDVNPTYWQIRSNNQGFHQNLSILDLIFNIGPEAALYIRGKM